MKYILDCFHCGELKVNPESENEAIDAKFKHENETEEWDHIVAIDTIDENGIKQPLYALE